TASARAGSTLLALSGALPWQPASATARPAMIVILRMSRSFGDPPANNIRSHRRLPFSGSIRRELAISFPELDLVDLAGAELGQGLVVEPDKSGQLVLGEVPGKE